MQRLTLNTRQKVAFNSPATYESFCLKENKLKNKKNQVLENSKELHKLSYC